MFRILRSSDYVTFSSPESDESLNIKATNLNAVKGLVFYDKKLHTNFVSLEKYKNKENCYIAHISKNRIKFDPNAVYSSKGLMNVLKNINFSEVSDLVGKDIFINNAKILFLD